MAAGRASQQPAMPAVGFINVAKREGNLGPWAAFRQGLGETDYVEERNITVDTRHFLRRADDRRCVAAECHKARSYDTVGDRASR